MRAKIKAVLDVGQLFILLCIIKEHKVKDSRSDTREIYPLHATNPIPIRFSS